MTGLHREIWGEDLAKFEGSTVQDVLCILWTLWIAPLRPHVLGLQVLYRR